MKKLRLYGEDYHYISKDGRQIPLKEMAYTHLENSIRKMERDGHDEEEINILIKELESRPEPEK